MPISGNQHFLRRINRLAVLRTIRLNPGISRVGLADRLGLTRPTIGALVDGLLSDHWLKEEKLGPTGVLGRRPVALHVNNERLALIGIDVQAGQILFTITTLSGDVRTLNTYPSPSRDPQPIFDFVASLIDEAYQTQTQNGIQIVGAGIAVPGPVSQPSGVLQYSESTGWHNQPILMMVQSRLDQLKTPSFPILIQRATDCNALYHFEFKRFGEEEPLLYVHTGRSIAAAIASQYTLFKGRRGTMGAVNHFVIDPKGPLCSCGKHGCANVLATLLAVQEASACPIAQIASAVQNENAQVIAALKEAGQHFGSLLYNLCQQFDPSRLFVGGPVYDCGEHFANAARERLNALRGSAAPEIELEIVEHRSTAVAQGAATGVLYAQLSTVK